MDYKNWRISIKIEPNFANSHKGGPIDYHELHKYDLHFSDSFSIHGQKQNAISAQLLTQTKEKQRFRPKKALLGEAMLFEQSPTKADYKSKLSVALQQFNSMELKCATIFLFAAMLSCGHALDWQAGGNWTTDNLTIIREKIFALQAARPAYTYISVAGEISDELNAVWAQAVNVFIITYSDGKNYDSVLYGYGFNRHWFWFNGFKVDAGYVSFIIWKDYNCLKWTSFSSFGSPQYNMDATLVSTIKSKLQEGRANPVRNVEDIWLFAQDIQATVPTSDASLFQDKTAYSIIAAPTTSVNLFGKFCAKQYMVAFSVGNKPGGYIHGTVLIMQMRDQ